MKAIGETSRGRQVRYEKVKTRRASRSWPNHAKCPASVSLSRSMHRYTYVLAHEREHYTQIYTRARTPSFAYIWTSANMCTHIHARCILHKRVGRPSRYLSASLHYRTRGSSRKERAREGDGGGWKPFSVPGTTGPSAKESMRSPFATRQNISSPHPPLIPLPSSSRIPRATKIEVRARCEKELEEPRGLRTNEFPFWFCESNLHRGSLKWKQPVRQQSAEPDTNPTEPTAVDRCLPEEETEERSRVMWRDSRGHGVNFNQNSLPSRVRFETTRLHVDRTRCYNRYFDGKGEDGV